MPICGPTNAIPSCAATPTVGFGSENHGFGGALGMGGLGSLGYGSSYGGTVSAASLGVLQGVHPACINQLPPSEVTVHPAPCHLTIPGIIMSGSTQGTEVGGYSPCALPGYGQGSGYGVLGYGNLGSGFLGSSGYNFGRGGFLGSGLLGSSGYNFGRGGFHRRRGSACLYPGGNVCV